MSITLEKSLINRDEIINAAATEIVGPSKVNSNSTVLNVIGNTVLTKDESYKNYYWNRGGIKEEVLQNTTPSRRYVAGILFPVSKKSVNEPIEVVEEFILEDIETTKVEVDTNKKEIAEESSNEISVTNDSNLPVSMGITCNISKKTKELNIKVNGGRYISHKVKVERTDRVWWLRESLNAELTVNVDNLVEERISLHEIDLFNKLNEKINNIKLELHIQCREHNNQRLTTVTLMNRSEQKSNTSANSNELMFFQAEIVLETNEGQFVSYPKYYQRNLPMTDNEAKDELLYRKKLNYAFGHGCSTTWEKAGEITKLKTTFVPTYETESMTPDVEILEGSEMKKVSIKMIDLANAKTAMDVRKLCMPLVEGYRQWIEIQETNCQELDGNLKEAAKSNIELCRESLKRIKNGLDLLENQKVLDAFVFANKAILLQQVNGKKVRKPTIRDSQVLFDIKYEEVVYSLKDLENSMNSWRAFQIAFFLMSLDSIVNETSADREIVDLIWFPTGGGKTEAYLGVAAFQMFYRRLIDKNDAGVDVLMRYTLRLLTADQFQRSSRLLCAMEKLRRENSDVLGETAYSIGMWVGSSTSPNSYEVALKDLASMKKNTDKIDFILDKCPWCGCKLGKSDKKSKMVLGYKKTGTKFITYCPDSSCEFFKEIPVYFIDEAIYEKKPTFLIGTIDKFVQLTWKPKARAIFGLNEDGEQVVSPPNLIIQDELHLISGPLGTLAGLYETVIEEFCTKRVDGKIIKPKIISATATIKEFEIQALNLFARETAKIFPSPCLDIDDSFFAKVAVDSNGNPLPGRKYVGLLSSTVGLLMTQVQVFSGILQQANQLDVDEKDPYWTLLAFYNSIRDLGAGLNLSSLDIPTYMKSIQSREAYEKNRYINNVLELTSRMNSNEVAKTIDRLKVELEDGNKAKTKEVLDLCLASNIIEVGVDIDRLALMAVVGQPKTTAQYIQVTGRVGRRWMERPGVIFTLYSNKNSRDKSHFEHFNEYHQRLYAQVETTSVTPFSDASVERGLNAILIAFLRQKFSKLIANEPNYHEFERIKKDSSYLEFAKKIMNRVKLIDPEQANFVKDKILEFNKKMESEKFDAWQASEESPQGLMHISGNPIITNMYPDSIPMINSLRSVDASSLGKITSGIINEKNIEPEADDEWGNL